MYARLKQVSLTQGELSTVTDQEVLNELPIEQSAQLPVLPLRDVVVYPHMVIPLFVGREKSIDALDAAMSSDKRIMLAAQTSAAVDEPGDADIHRVGTIATILQLLKLPDGTIKVLVEGGQRALIDNVSTAEKGYFLANYSFPEAVEAEESDKLEGKELDVLVRSVTNMFDQYVKMNKKVPPEILSSLTGVDDADRLADMIAAQMSLRVEEKQTILELFDPGERLEHLLKLMESELDMLQVEKRIRGRVKQQMEKSQREYYLNEQMKAIQKELGEMDEVPNETEELARKIAKGGLSKEARKKATAELNKLKMMSPMSAEATVVRNYIDTLVSLPWKKKSKLKNTLKQAEETLEHDHYGLEKVKERILEYLAVQKRVGHAKGPILCLVGPPGVGKTSLGKSIAAATGRRFSRMALGGVRDEAEIRGHRRTYIGSMPGKIVQNLAKVKRRNPLILLDEIDKMSTDFRGDPSSALLEVLDPEQNHTFTDHYLEVEYDLSDVMFVATANTMNIPEPLLDRMEVIRIPGYTEMEKANIAERYLLPRKMTDNGLDASELTVSDDAIMAIIRSYTREAGVRNLEREVAKICRKVVREVMELELAEKEGGQSSKDKLVSVTAENIGDYLGVARFRHGRAEKENQVGQVTGLAWTSVGGELLTIESTVVPGKGKLSSTGQLGEVMQESIQAAMMVVRSRAQSLGIDADFHEKLDIHLHVPEGATPKDGPSAGVGMCTAIVSCLTNVPVRANVAMTGEITLRGEVLPIGGLKEKLLAAQRGGIDTVLIPIENEKDLSEIPDEIKSGLDIRPVQWIDEVLAVALASSPGPDGEKLADPVSGDDLQGGAAGEVRTH
ncbi:Lon protease [Granulosicoccus antarcticus IMCC3135]|uniref:Lon protease n=2 Tax=Granulosicoccus TaxID=437504 RepID=A0A2Z2P3J2_9GAMM|nr:Lon protease [Granulosicoccus antarcticus IMCC3135]